MRWIIGDIHGMLRPLEALLELIRSADSSPRFLFVGDYVNRGPDSKRVIDLLLNLPKSRFIRGNHDDIFDQVLHDRSYAPNASENSRLAAFQWFMQHGLDNTLLSYGADWAELDYALQHPTLARLDTLLKPIPQAHRDFVRSLPPVIEEEDLFVAHGLWDPDGPADSLAQHLLTEEKLRHFLLWGRYEPDQITRNKPWTRAGYFGHTPVYNYPDLLEDQSILLPILGPKIALLDTAAALLPEGRLSAICHESQQVLQVDRQGKPVSKQT